LETPFFPYNYPTFTITLIYDIIKVDIIYKNLNTSQGGLYDRKYKNVTGKRQPFFIYHW